MVENVAISHRWRDRPSITATKKTHHGLQVVLHFTLPTSPHLLKMKNSAGRNLFFQNEKRETLDGPCCGFLDFLFSAPSFHSTLFGTREQFLLWVFSFSKQSGKGGMQSDWHKKFGIFIFVLFFPFIYKRKCRQVENLIEKKKKKRKKTKTNARDDNWKYWPMQLGSRCLVLFSFARSHYCAILFFSSFSNTNERELTNTNEIDFIRGSIPPHRSCHAENVFFSFAPFVYDFPVHQRYSHHERCPSDFSCFMQIYPPASFYFSRRWCIPSIVYDFLFLFFQHFVLSFIYYYFFLPGSNLKNNTPEISFVFCL